MCSWPCTTVIRPPQDVDVLAVLVLGRLPSMQQITESYAHSRNDIYSLFQTTCDPFMVGSLLPRVRARTIT